MTALKEDDRVENPVTDIPPTETTVDPDGWTLEIESNLEAILNALDQESVLEAEVRQRLQDNDVTEKEKCSLLIEFIRTSDETTKEQLQNVFTRLNMAVTIINSPNKTEQEQNNDTAHVASKQETDPTQGVEKPPVSTARPYQDILREASGTFIDCLQPNKHLLHQLQVNSVLNNDMVLKIQCRPNRPDKVRVLLAFLMTLGPKSFLAFIEALKGTQHQYLANILAAQECI